MVIVLPTYNEAENVLWLIPETLKIVGEKWECWFLVVDDSSPDGTAEIAERLRLETGRVRVLKRPKKLGLGSAYVDGFKYVFREMPWADYVCEMDADGSHPPEVLVELLRRAEETGADVVIASRYGGRGGWEEKSLLRESMSRGANLLARIVTGMNVRDMTSGFRVIRTGILEKIIGKLGELNSGYVFQVELLYNLHKIGAKIIEHPFIFKRRRSGESKLGLGEVKSYAWWCIKVFFRRIMR